MAPPKKSDEGPEGHLRTALQEIALAGSYPGADMEGLAHLQAQVTQMLHAAQSGQQGAPDAQDPGQAVAGLGGGQPPGAPPGGPPTPGGMPPEIGQMLGIQSGAAGGMGGGLGNPAELAKLLGPATKGGVQ